MTKYEKVVFSGVQPTGNLHLGNYLGAIKNWSNLVNDEQNHNTQFIFSIVGLHSITIDYNPKQLMDNIFNIAASYIACGIDPSLDNVIIFEQSSVSCHSELAWILSCITPIGWLNRMTQFKEKSGSNRENSNLALFSYPVLMAADILLYQTTSVPVGEDQVQHLELTRDIAKRFNQIYSVDFFKIPKIVLDKGARRIMSLRDASKKMSKSEVADFSRINLIDDADTIRKKISKAKTDSESAIYYDQEKRPEMSNLLNIYSSISGKSIEELVNIYSGKSNAQFKSDLTEVLIAEISPIKKKANELMNNKDYLGEILQKGYEKAEYIAKRNFNDIKALVGLV